MRVPITVTLLCGLLGFGVSGESEDTKVHGCGVLGNCCTHGAGLCNLFKNHPRTRVVTAYTLIVEGRTVALPLESGENPLQRKP